MQIFDFQPGRCAAADLIDAMLPLRHGAFEIVRAGSAEEIDAAFADVVHISNLRFHARHDAFQDPLITFNERQHSLLVHQPN